MSVSPVTTRTLAARFVNAVAQVLRGQMLLALGAAILVALAEGAGLVLLVPLLGTIGLTVSEGPTTGLAHTVERTFGWFGLQPTLPAVLGVFVIVSLTHATLVRANSLIAPRLEQRFITSLRQRLYAALIGARWSFLAQQKSSDLVHAVTVDIERVSMATYQLFALASASVITVAYLAVALRLSVPMTVAAALGGAIVLWAMRGRTQASERLADVYVQASREVMSAAAESMTGLKVLKALGDDGRHVSGFGRLSQRFSDTYVAMLRSLADSKWRLDLGAAVLVSIVLLVAVGVFELRGAGLLLLLFIFARVVPRLAGVQQTAQLLATGLPSFGSVMSLIDRCEQEAERLDAEQAVGPALTGDVRLDDVSFRYTEAAASALERVTLDIPAGRIDCHCRCIRRGKVDARGSRDGAAHTCVGRGVDRWASAGRSRNKRMAAVRRVRRARRLSASRHDPQQPALGPPRRDRRGDVGSTGPGGRPHVRRGPSQSAGRGRRRPWNPAVRWRASEAGARARVDRAPVCA